MLCRAQIPGKRGTVGVLRRIRPDSLEPGQALRNWAEPIKADQNGFVTFKYKSVSGNGSVEDIKIPVLDSMTDMGIDLSKYFIMDNGISANIEEFSLAFST